jgi:hypothetical protein
MPEEKEAGLIGSMYCTQYQCEARFYVEPPHTGNPRPATDKGVRHLLVLYGDGYTGRHDLAISANGEREFAIGIPDDWSMEKLLDFLLHPKSPEGPLPEWEAPKRGYGLTMLGAAGTRRETSREG